MAHKVFGIKRSKLEKFIETQLNKELPHLQYKINSIEEIGYELDFFFPDYKLGIEINGAFHYEPIHGIKRLLGIQHNDAKKIQLCNEKGIQLIVYKDINHQFNKEFALKQWKLIKQYIIDKL